VIGLIPAGGRATRVSPLPCSKELFPIGFQKAGESSELSPKVVSHYLLERMRLANIRKAFIIIREGKWDIPGYFGDGKMLDMHMAYLMMDLPFGVPYTLDQAYPFVQDSIVALGFPDIIFQPEDAFDHLLKKQSKSDADIVLGLFPAKNTQKTDMVEFGPNGGINKIQIKPSLTDLVYSWEIAVWTYNFTQFMHDYVLSKRERYSKNNFNNNTSKRNEMHISEVVQSAIEEGMAVTYVVFDDGACVDIGTPEDMIGAICQQVPLTF